MTDPTVPEVSAPQGEPSAGELVSVLSQKVVGQPEVMRVIVPFLEMYKANLSPEGRPVGVFLLLGPTGTGKTRTVEALAEVLHGSPKKLVKINCGEYQMDHEVAKLIGAPPGYLGHRETTPALTQAKLTEMTSEQSDLSLVLFDEIEKAAPSLTQLLLGVLDKASLQLGDNSSVNFERSMIFLTSNLAAREMAKQMQPQLGFHSDAPTASGELNKKLELVALAAVRRAFSPEFINRLDAVITYHPLGTDSLTTILDQHIAELQDHVNTRLGPRCFHVEVTPESRQFLLGEGTSEEYGARELKRTIHRQLTQPLATLVARGRIDPGARVRVVLNEDSESLSFRTEPGPKPVVIQQPTMLVVDDNADLLGFLEQLIARAGWKVVAAQSASETRRLIAAGLPEAALLDYALPDGNGVALGVQLQKQNPQIDVIVMTGGHLPLEEEAICAARGFPILRKPFLGADVTQLLRTRHQRATTAKR
jgi:CheY-like chemotaxis protein